MGAGGPAGVTRPLPPICGLQLSAPGCYRHLSTRSWPGGNIQSSEIVKNRSLHTSDTTSFSHSVRVCGFCEYESGSESKLLCQNIHPWAGHTCPAPDDTGPHVLWPLSRPRLCLGWTNHRFWWRRVTPGSQFTDPHYPRTKRAVRSTNVWPLSAFMIALAQRRNNEAPPSTHSGMFYSGHRCDERTDIRQHLDKIRDSDAGSLKTPLNQLILSAFWVHNLRFCYRTTNSQWRSSSPLPRSC